jgi:hypothetical protein
MKWIDSAVRVLRAKCNAPTCQQKLAIGSTTVRKRELEKVMLFANLLEGLRDSTPAKGSVGIVKKIDNVFATEPTPPRYGWRDQGSDNPLAHVVLPKLQRTNATWMGGMGGVMSETKMDALTTKGAGPVWIRAEESTTTMYHTDDDLEGEFLETLQYAYSGESVMVAWESGDMPEGELYEGNEVQFFEKLRQVPSLVVVGIGKGETWWMGKGVVHMVVTVSQGGKLNLVWHWQ